MLVIDDGEERNKVEVEKKKGKESIIKGKNIGRRKSLEEEKGNIEKIEDRSRKNIERRIKRKGENSSEKKKILEKLLKSLVSNKRKFYEER